LNIGLAVKMTPKVFHPLSSLIHCKILKKILFAKKTVTKVTFVHFLKCRKASILNTLKLIRMYYYHRIERVPIYRVSL